MTNLQIRLDWAHVVNFVSADRDYAEVKRSYLLGSYYTYFKTFLFGNRNESPVVWSPKFDCDDFARLFCALIMLAHFQGQGSAAEGVAVGEIHYFQKADPTKGHAIVCAYTDAGRIFIEPQTGEELKLTNEEIRTVFFARF